MKGTKILSASTVKMPYSRTTEEILPYIRIWLKDEDARTIEKATRIFEMSEVGTRHSIMSIEDVFTQTSFEEKNRVFISEMKTLCKEALELAIEKADIKTDDLKAIITVCCTGIMIPSMDAYLVNSLRLPRDIMRLPVTEMGCAGGTSAMIYGHQYLQSKPGTNIALVAFESPTATFQHQDTSMTNVVSSAIFSDGVSALILGPSEETRPEILDTKMFHFYDEEDMMGFDLVNSGLKMILNPDLPDKIEDNFEDIYEPFLKENDVDIKDINHLIFHPGGKKIIKLVEEKFRHTGQNLNVTKDVMYHHGNMSSATIFYVIEKYLNMNIPKGDLGLMLSFGPGFTAQLILVRWN